jgi:hypothetical protein
MPGLAGGGSGVESVLLRLRRLQQGTAGRVEGKQKAVRGLLRHIGACEAAEWQTLQIENPSKCF